MAVMGFHKIPATMDTRSRILRPLAAALATLAFTFGPAALAQTQAAPVETSVLSSALRHAKMADLGGEHASADVRHIANWAVDSGDHGGLPFVIVDKVDSRVFVFDAGGHLRGATPALVGAARGDDSVPGIGSRQISSILPEERTTPAGRFKAVMGRGPSGEDILWVDYDGALALHRVVTNNPKERRLQRLQSKLAAERRITYGCINVPVNFYETVVAPTFGRTPGIVYILPESRRPQELFGSYDVPAAATRTSALQLPTAH
jgi:hypothetical protein